MRFVFDLCQFLWNKSVGPLIMLGCFVAFFLFAIGIEFIGEVIARSMLGWSDSKASRYAMDIGLIITVVILGATLCLTVLREEFSKWRDKKYTPPPSPK